MSLAPLPRVRFRERQPLTAADLNAEQAHRLALRRRHNAGQHGWGIVTGLALAEDSGALLVDAGMAVDGYGRELVLPAPVRIDRAALDKAAGNDGELVVSLLYGREPAARDRWREVCRLRLTAAGALDALPAFQPQETPPDDPETEWPVPLGVVKLASAKLDVRRSTRVYATLVGEELRDPAGRARLAFGRVEGRERLALGLRDAAGETVERLAVERLPLPLPVRARPGECPPRIAAAPPPFWKATVRATTARAGGLKLKPLQDGGPRGLQFATPIPVPETPAPWRIYRVAADPEGAHPAELRFEIGHPGDKGDPTTHKLVLGDVDDGAILPWLTVTADCTVTVHGDLIVEGQVIRAPVPSNPDDPAFAGVVTDAWAKGISAAVSRFPGGNDSQDEVADEEPVP
jgi:hypothetical protein